jgi:rSAM/selenodomain-associated transferase 2
MAMMDTATGPELSVIVPVLNEAAILPALFQTLGSQGGIAMELVLSDGGSTDGSVSVARRLAADSTFPVTVVTGKMGRGWQLNEGAAAARGKTFLFLHADSSFADPFALRTGAELLDAAAAARGDERAAGRFALRFDRHDGTPSLAYYYYECKARLGRRECIHGDQGLMLRRTFFDEVGPFDGTLPMLAETRLADAVRQRGEWLLFPAEISTSARRFEAEGFYERQLLNAILMNFAAMRWDSFFSDFPLIYSDHGGRLKFAPVLRQIGGIIAHLPLRRRLSLWCATGAYVRSHAWQIPFFFDVRNSFRRGLASGTGNTPLLAFYDRQLERLTDHPPGRLTAAALTWFWFRLTCLFASGKERMAEKRREW